MSQEQLNQPKTFNISNYNQDDFTATYTPEDNKLRLYAEVRIDSEDWAIMKASGWRWAPKQELFYTHWSVTDEDFCMALAGEILPEEMTMAERAEFKAERLIELAKKRSVQAFGYEAKAREMMARIGNNQPILAGHHSQRKAEKESKQLDRTIEHAVERSEAVGYWLYRAAGVLSHADHKNSGRTIANRIKKLLAEFRTYQRSINTAFKVHSLALRIQGNPDEEIRHKHAQTVIEGCWQYRYGGAYDALRNKEVTVDQALQMFIDGADRAVTSTHKARTIAHLLNRLAYEQSNLGLVDRYDGELGAGLLQTFLRTHGAEKPKVTKGEDGTWIAESDVPFPLHIHNGMTFELDDNDWRDLMQSVGYEVPNKPKLAPILNFDYTEKARVIKKIYDTGLIEIPQITMTKEEYNKVHKDRRWTRKSYCGTYRFKTVNLPKSPDAPYYQTVEYAVFISDSKAHPVPESLLNREVETA